MNIAKSVIGVAVAIVSLHVTAADDGSYQVLDLPAKPRPSTVDEAVADILRGMSEQDKDLVRSTAKADLIKFHRGWGMGIRNGYGLWGANDKLRASACGSPTCHPEDASHVIIEAVWAALQKK